MKKVILILTVIAAITTSCTKEELPKEETPKEKPVTHEPYPFIQVQN